MSYGDVAEKKNKYATAKTGPTYAAPLVPKGHWVKWNDKIGCWDEHGPVNFGEWQPWDCCLAHHNPGGEVKKIGVTDIYIIGKSYNHFTGELRTIGKRYADEDRVQSVRRYQGEEDDE
jgi:hypothetical protein